LKLVWCALASAFFGSAVAKLRSCGLGWALSDNLSIILMQAPFRPYGSGTILGNWLHPIARNVWLTAPLATITLMFEFFFPLALVNARGRKVIVPVSALFLIVDAVSLVPSFILYLICYTVWIPWERLGARFGAILQRYAGPLWQRFAEAGRPAGSRPH